MGQQLKATKKEQKRERENERQMTDGSHCFHVYYSYYFNPVFPKKSISRERGKA